MIRYLFVAALLLAPFASCVQHKLCDIEIKEVWIPMPDGTKLAADLYMPKAQDPNERFPILLEYLPYRKDEQRKLRYPVFSYFVQRGYIIARVDIRGTGRSDGKLIKYEYTDQEQEDGEKVIDWLSSQDFSTGAVGMFGISWGGFNAIQIAMRNPPALKAILAMMATDDIYEDDVHFIDGMMHIDAYEIGRDLKNVIPPAPDYQIDENYFRDKFDTEPWLLLYKRQQRDGSFWDRASLNANYNALTTPIFMISGWYDGYRDSTPRILENVTAPKKAIVGPWNHTFPHMSDPPPSIEWRNEAVRWFDHWLKGEENGIMDEPELAVFIRDGHGPGMPDSIMGRWKWINQWPPQEVTESTYYLNDSGLQPNPNTSEKTIRLSYKASSGIEASGSVMWWGDWSEDQKKTDEHSLVFESSPLEEKVTILGFPRVHLNTSVSSGQSHFFARLSDVSSDSLVTIVTGSGLNGSHRNSSSNPEYLQPGKNYPINIELHFTSWTFQQGHRIRLSISNGQWPMIWPNPSNLTLSLRLGGNDQSRLTLPELSEDTSTTKPVFIRPSSDPKLPGYLTTKFGTVSGFAEISDLSYDPATGVTSVTATNAGGTIYPWAKWTTSEKIIHKVNDNDPAHAAVESEYTIDIKTDTDSLKLVGILDFSSDASTFYYKYTRKLLKGDSLIRTRTWNEEIARDFQ